MSLCKAYKQTNKSRASEKTLQQPGFSYPVPVFKMLPLNKIHSHNTTCPTRCNRGSQRGWRGGWPSGRKFMQTHWTRKKGVSKSEKCILMCYYTKFSNISPTNLLLYDWLDTQMNWVLKYVSSGTRAPLSVSKCWGQRLSICGCCWIRQGSSSRRTSRNGGARRLPVCR